jgi:hypothetical protein
MSSASTSTVRHLYYVWEKVPKEESVKILQEWSDQLLVASSPANRDSIDEWHTESSRAIDECLRRFYQLMLELSCWIAAVCFGLVGNIVTGLLFSYFLSLVQQLELWHWLAILGFSAVIVMMFLYVIHIFSNLAYSTCINIDCAKLGFGVISSDSRSELEDPYVRAIETLWCNIIFNGIVECLGKTSRSNGSLFAWRIELRYNRGIPYGEIHIWTKKCALNTLMNSLSPSNTCGNLRDWQGAFLASMDLILFEMSRLQVRQLDENGMADFVERYQRVLQERVVEAPQPTLPYLRI